MTTLGNPEFPVTLIVAAAAIVVLFLLPGCVGGDTGPDLHFEGSVPVDGKLIVR